MLPELLEASKTDKVDYLEIYFGNWDPPVEDIRVWETGCGG